jgi:hypothetical protein
MRGRFLVSLLVFWGALILLLDAPSGLTQPPGGKKGKGPKMETGTDLPDLTVDKKVLEAWNLMAELEFKKKDQNNDGLLSSNEMPGKLRDELELWDRNKDEHIDLAEYRAHFGAHVRQKAAKDPQKWTDLQRLDKDISKWAAKDTANILPKPSLAKPTPGVITIIIEDERPLVWRAGKLPPGLPPWFTQLDKNSDGQVAMYEWRAGGMPLKDFLTMDLNDDGLLTPDEVLRSAAKNNNSKTPANATPYVGNSRSVWDKEIPFGKEGKPKKEKKEKKPKDKLD